MSEEEKSGLESQARDDAGRFAAPTPTPEATPAPEGISLTSEQLKERMDRHFKSQLRQQFGTDDPSQVMAQLEQAKALQEAEEARKREQMTREEQLQADLAAAQTAREEAEALNLQLEFDAHVSRSCAELGIQNVDYAGFQLASAVDSMTEEEAANFDPQAHLKGLLESPQHRAAFGIQTPPEVTPTPVTTTTPEAGHPPPPQAGQPPNNLDASKMTKEQFSAHLASLGVSG